MNSFPNFIRGYCEAVSLWEGVGCAGSVSTLKCKCLVGQQDATKSDRLCPYGIGTPMIQGHMQT